MRVIGVVFGIKLSWFGRGRLGLRIVGLSVGEQAQLTSHEQKQLATREQPRDLRRQGVATRDEGLSLWVV